MHKILMWVLGAGLAAAATLQFPGPALAAKKGSERGFGFIRPADSQRIIYDKNNGRTKGIGDPEDRKYNPRFKGGKG